MDRRLKWKHNHPLKRWAQRQVEYMVRRMRRRGEQRPVCKACGATPTQFHHSDYSQPLIGEWLCKEHHYQADEIRRSLDRLHSSLSASA